MGRKGGLSRASCNREVVGELLWDGDPPGARSQSIRRAKSVLGQKKGGLGDAGRDTGKWVGVRFRVLGLIQERKRCQGLSGIEQDL
jgi:hypothetical protein